ncbi:MAG: MotA/TolQ/ExbB proton channel family protein [Candidatus Lernaella stagnicola]|nr:MotA/TolQ/ExbB proton channel family protein [Candidatus Lernaella stagnicola]
MSQSDTSLSKRIKQPNVIVIAALIVVLLVIALMSPAILESKVLAAKFKPMVGAAGRVCVFLLYAMTIILLVNYVYYGVFLLNRRNFYSESQRRGLVKVLANPEARADIQVFRNKSDPLTVESNILTEIVAAMLPNALKQQFMLEQYFKAKIENYMNRFAGPINTITTLSGLGPIVGFLGTLLGLILAFAVSAEAIQTEGQMSPDTFSELQYSIMIAIMTSVFGVVIKILGSILRQALLAKVDKINDEISTIPIESMYSN